MYHKCKRGKVIHGLLIIVVQQFMVVDHFIS